MGTKKHPGKFDCYSRAKENEPLFVLLARDPFAPMLVRLWATIRKLMGKEDEKYREALECADSMDHWKGYNPNE